MSLMYCVTIKSISPSKNIYCSLYRLPMVLRVMNELKQEYEIESMTREEYERRTGDTHKYN